MLFGGTFGAYFSACRTHAQHPTGERTTCLASVSHVPVLTLLRIGRSSPRSLACAATACMCAAGASSSTAVTLPG
jgi:hypothetical protein